MSQFAFVVDDQFVTFPDARAHADTLRDGAVQIGAQWSARRARVLELHRVCRGLIDERERVAKRDITFYVRSTCLCRRFCPVFYCNDLGGDADSDLVGSAAIYRQADRSVNEIEPLFRKAFFFERR